MVATVAELLAAADAEEYTVHFRREGFRTVREILDASLTQRDLDQLGVNNAEARNRIVRVLFRTNSAAAAGEEQDIESDTLTLWLSELGVQTVCAPRFRAEGFNSLQEVVDARLTEDDLKDLGLETMKARKAALKSLVALTSEANIKHGASGQLGAAAEATFVESYRRHRRLSAASLTSAAEAGSFQSAAGFSSSDGEFAASDDDGGNSPVNGRSAGVLDTVEDELIRAIGVLPAGDLQAPLLAAEPMMQHDDGELQNLRQTGDDIGQATMRPKRLRLTVVGLLALGMSTAFILLWLASYNFDLTELIKREVEDYRVGDSVFDLAVMLLFASMSLLAGALLSCINDPDSGCRRAIGGTSTAAVLVLPALSIGDNGEQLDRVALRIGALTVLVGYLPIVCVGVRWSQLLQTGIRAGTTRSTLAEQLRLGFGLALVTAASVFTAVGLAFGESALTGRAGAPPTEARWFTVGLPIAAWTLTSAAIGWVEGLAAAVLLLAPEVEQDASDEPQSQRRSQQTQPRKGLVLGSESLASFLGGFKLLQAVLFFLGAHTTSFPLWPVVSGFERAPTGWQWAAGLAGGSAGLPATLWLAALSCFSVLSATRDPELFLLSRLAGPTIFLCQALDSVGPVRALDGLINAFRDSPAASRSK